MTERNTLNFRKTALRVLNSEEILGVAGGALTVVPTDTDSKACPTTKYSDTAVCLTDMCNSLEN